MGKNEGEITHALDGERLKSMVFAGLTRLRQNQATINALNVFPVPDGDTGTNMTLTMTSAWDEVAEFSEDNIGRMASKVAHGALMGARGNSGVILSQILRGFARSLDDKMQMQTGDLAAAMQEAAETAYKGVVKPVEGTILTVIREVAEEAAQVVQETDDLLLMFERLVNRARAAEELTPTLLPVLRQAGVVDSGGQGLVVILEGMLRDLQGLPLDEPERLAHVADLRELDLRHSKEDMEAELLDFDSAYPYDVQFIVMGSDMNVDNIRSHIEAMGDCPLVVGDADTIKVHVHVADPGQPISYGAKCGFLHDVVVENMQAQYEAYMAERAPKPECAPDMALPPAALLYEEPQAISVVVVSAGDGLKQVFMSLGATLVVEGGQTMNPSTAQILEALEKVPSDKVVVLPNNKNVLMACEQAAEVCEKQVAVVPTRSIPQGVSALLALDQQSPLDHNVASMERTITEVISGEVTWATRDVELNGVAVREGDAIGLLEGQLIVDSSSFEEAVHWLLAEADLEDCELVTLYYGEGVSEEQADALANTLGEAYPNLEFEVVAGGQPHYPYIISIE